MTKAYAPSYSESLLDDGTDLMSGDVKIVALDSTYVYDDAHDFLNDLTGIVTTSANLTGKDNTGGWFDFDDLSLGSPAAGDTITQCWVYLDTGVSSTSQLVYYFDEDEGGSPISEDTDGTAITFVVPVGGLFRV